MKKRRVEMAMDGLNRIMDITCDWDAEVQRFTATGSDDDDVIVTHDCTGRIIECSLRPGLQQELTLTELEDEVNNAIGANAERAREGLDALTEKWLAKFADIPAELTEHPVADQLTATLQRSTSTSTGA